MTDFSSHPVLRVALLLHHLHRVLPVALLLAQEGRPVLHAHDLDELEGPGEHDHLGGALLPDQPPEVGDGRLQRALGDQAEGVAAVAGHVARVDVAVVFQAARPGRQPDAVALERDRPETRLQNKYIRNTECSRNNKVWLLYQTAIPR